MKAGMQIGQNGGYLHREYDGTSQAKRGKGAAVGVCSAKLMINSMVREIPTNDEADHGFAFASKAVYAFTPDCRMLCLSLAIITILLKRKRRVNRLLRNYRQRGVKNIRFLHLFALFSAFARGGQAALFLRRKLSAIIAINSEFVGLPRLFCTV